MATIEMRDRKLAVKRALEKRVEAARVRIRLDGDNLSELIIGCDDPEAVRQEQRAQLTRSTKE